MADLPDVIGYLYQHYPHKSELSKARLTKMVYLADWKSVLERNSQLTDIEWFFNNYGPYVDDVWQIAFQANKFNLEHGQNMFGGVKETMSIKKPFSPALSAEDRWILDHVIKQTKRLYWDDFIKLVYSTYPVLTGVRGENLDLVGAANRYRSEGANRLTTAQMQP
ncbi:MAG: DUF4065 domain-containing protein [Gammaproteobacteria bacterium]|nr:DUF4065 domain-containing protein [Gammaproteobacteria bacterium]